MASDDDRARLGRRLRWVSAIALGAAAVACVTGFVPDGLASWSDSWFRGSGGGAPVHHSDMITPFDVLASAGDPGPPTVHTSIAGGWTLVVWTLVQVAIGLWVLRRPTRRRAMWWWVSAVVTTPIALLMWSLVERDLLFQSTELRGVGHVTFACADLAAAMLVLVLPIVVLATRVRTSSAS